MIGERKVTYFRAVIVARVGHRLLVRAALCRLIHQQAPAYQSRWTRLALLEHNSALTS